MSSYNKVILMGNITRDVAYKILPSQTAIAEFGLAMNRKFKTAGGEDREEVCFVDVTAFSRQAEVINEYCRKGDPILIEGRLKLDTWDDKNGGGKRSKLTVVVEEFKLMGSRRDDGAEQGDEQPAPAQRPTTTLSQDIAAARRGKPQPAGRDQRF